MKINLDKLDAWIRGNSEADASLRAKYDDERQPPASLGLTSEQQTELKERFFPGVKPPTPVPATKQLRANLERVTLAYNDRERVLVKEIAEREAELADVRRARDATTLALIELDESTLDEIMAEFPEGIDVTQIDGALDLSEYYVEAAP